MIRIAEPDEPDEQEEPAIAVSVRCRPQWKAYVERLAASERLTISSLLDRSVEEYARAIHFGEIPPKR